MRRPEGFSVPRRLFENHKKSRQPGNILSMLAAGNAGISVRHSSTCISISDPGELKAETESSEWCRKKEGKKGKTRPVLISVRHRSVVDRKSTL